MKKAYINWKLVLVLVLGFCAVGATVVGLRKFNRTQRAEEGLKTGLQAYEEKRWKEAAIGLGQYLSVHQSDMEVLLKYGHAQSRIQPYKRENYAQAVNAYRSVLRSEESNKEAALALIDLYLQGQIPNEAEAAASRFLEKNTDSQISQRLATAQVMQRKFEEAAKLLMEIVAREPAEVAPYELLAHIAQERPELLKKTPQEWIDAAVEKNPQKAQAYMLRSGFCLRTGKRDQAIQNLEQAARCDLSDVNTHLAIVAAWLRLGTLEKAQEQLDILQKENPALPELWQLRAALVAQYKDPAKAAQTAREGLEQLGENKAVFLPYAIELFLQADDVEAARNAVEQLRKAEANRGLVCYFEGLLAERGGDWPRAMAQWREAVVQGYTAESVYLKLAEGAARLEDQTSAIEILRRYIGQNGRSFSARLMLARILMEQRQWTEASEYVAAAVRLSSDSKEAQSLQNRCRIELLATQPQSQGRVDQLLTELIAGDDSLQNQLLALRVAMGRKDWLGVQQRLDSLKKRYGETLQIRMVEAEYCLQSEKKEQAAGILDEMIKQFTEASEPVILRAAMLTEQNNNPQALALLEDAASRLKGQDQRKVQLWMADLYRQTEQTEKAVDLFSKMAVQNPQDILVRRQLIAFGRETADIAQLQKWVDEIKQIEGEAGRLWKIEQVSLWMARGEFEKMYPQAVTLMNENLAVNSDDKQSLMLLAGAHELAGNLRLAVSLYRDTLTRNPDDIDLAIAAMGAMYRAQEYRQADQLLADLLASGHSDPRLAQLELQGHLRQGRLDTAGELLEKMVARNTHDSSSKLSLAMLRTRSGQFDAAKKLIDELLTENPDVITSHAALADWYLRQDQKEKAIAACNDYLAQHDTVDAYRLRSQVLLALNEKEKAIADIEQLLKRAGDNADILLNVSELYGAAGLREKALETSRKALAIQPDAFDTQKQMAILLLASPQSQREGMELLEKALTQQPRDAQLRLRKASLLLGQGAGPAAAEAVEMLNALANEYPRLELAWGYLVEWYLLNNQTGMAMDTVLRGLVGLPESRALLMYKARIEALRSPSVALDTLNQLARRFPADETIIEMQAQQMHRLGKTDEAIKLLRDGVASSRSPNTVQMKLPLMEMLYQKGTIDQAEQLYKELQQEPDISSVAMLRWLRLISKTSAAEQSVAVFQRWYDAHPKNSSVALLVLKDMLADGTAEAAKMAEQILALVQSREPDSSEAAYGMAMLWHMTGRKLEAIPLYERALQLQPDNVVAMNNLAWILSQEKGEHAKALELADKGLALNPNYTDMIDTRGMIYFSLRQYDKAAQDFQIASNRYLDGQPSKTASTFHLAQCLRQLGKNEQALVELYKARDLDEKTNGLSAQEKTELAEMLRQK